MTDPVKEQLSAYLDGELPAAELDLLLKQMQRDPHLHGSVGRYALVGEMLRSGSAAMPSTGFAARISQAIAAEAASNPNPVAAPLPRHAIAARWLRPVGGAAIAAGVAAFAVMVLQPQAPETADSAAAPGLVADAGQSGPAADRYIVPAATPVTQIVPATYLAKYVMAHAEYASPLGRRAVLSSVLSDDDESELSETVDISTPPEIDRPKSQP